MGLIKYEAEATLRYVMDEELQELINLVNAELCGERQPLAMAYKIPLAEIYDELVNTKYSELIYNTQTEVPLVIGTPAGGMVIWLLPR